MMNFNYQQGIALINFIDNFNKSSISDPIANHWSFDVIFFKDSINLAISGMTQKTYNFWIVAAILAVALITYILEQGQAPWVLT